MQRYKIELPDKRVLTIEAPDEQTALQDADAWFAQNKQAATSSGPSMIESGALGALQGATLGFSDEIVGGLSAAGGALLGNFNVSENYQRGRDVVRQANEAASEANPGSYLVGELAGGIVLPGGVARAAPAALKTAAQPALRKAGFGATRAAAGGGIGKRIVASAREGAAYGAAYGIGTGEGSFTDQAENALQGGVAGGLVGGVLPPVVDGVQAVGRAVAAPVRGYLQKDRVAAEKMAESLARDVGSSGSADDGAKSIERIRARATAAQDDPTMMLGDLGNENTRRLLRQASNMPNDNAQRFNKRLDQRQNFQPNRLERSAQSNLAGGREFLETNEALVAERAAKAEPAFRQAYQEPFNVAKDDELAGFLSRGYMKRLVDKTKETISGMSGKGADDIDALFDDMTELSPKERRYANEIKEAMEYEGYGPDYSQLIFDNYKYLKSTAKGKAPERLSSFLIRRGGLRNEGDEIATILGSNRARPGMMNQKGLTLDDAALMAWERGFMPGSARPDINEFLRLLSDDLRGKKPVYSSAAADDAAEMSARDEMETALDKLGIGPDMPERVVKEGLGLKQTTKRSDALKGEQIRPWELLHRVKMEINREIQRVKRGEQDAVANWTLNDLYKLNDEFKALLGSKNRKLGDALSEFADESSLINALEDGLDDFQKISPEEISAKIRAMSDDEAKLYRLGHARAIIEKIRKPRTTSDRTDNIFASRDVQMKLRALFPNASSKGPQGVAEREALRAFQRDLVREARKADTRKAVQGGSMTDRNLINAQEAGQPSQMLKTGAQVARGDVLGPVLDYLGRIGNRFSGLNPSSSEALLELAMRRASPESIEPLIDALRKSAAQPASQAQLAGRLAVGAGYAPLSLMPKDANGALASGEMTDRDLEMLLAEIMGSSKPDMSKGDR